MSTESNTTPELQAFNPTWVCKQQTFGFFANKAFAPITQTFEYIGSGTPPEYLQFTLQKLDFVTGNYADICTIKGEVFNKKVRFTYDTIIQSLFDNETHGEHDGRLAVQVKLPYVPEGSAVDTIPLQDVLFINANSAHGEPNYLASNKFLTEYQTIKRYDFFPLTFSFALFDDSDIVIDDITQGRFLIEKGKHYTISRDVSKKAVIRDSSGVRTDSRKIKVLPVPKHPFYVRYINTMGGYDYLMLSCRQTEKAEVKTETQIYPTIWDNSEYTRPINLGRAAERTITASTGLLPIDDFDIASKIIFSPLIERYTKYGKWQPLTLLKGAVEKQNTDTQGELTLTFALPPLYMQK